jgi:DNA-binding transcriptional LysR family regulator
MFEFYDMYLFSKVVEHNGITGAARALGVAPSRISRRTRALETSLNAQLIQRSTRHFKVTDLGKKFNEHCVKMIAEAQSAYDKVEEAQAKPSGLVRIYCQTMLAQFVIGPLIPLFMIENPGVRISIETIEKSVTISDNFDLIIRICFIPCDDSSMVIRPLGIFQSALVASPRLFDNVGRPNSLEELKQLPTIDYCVTEGQHSWPLIGPNNEEIKFHHDPALIVDDYVVMRQAALLGTGIAPLPLALCLEDIRLGTLEIVLPQFSAPVAELQAVFPSRRGLLPTVRSVIDFLGAHCVGDLEHNQIVQHSGHGRHGATRFWTSRQPINDIVGLPDARSQRSQTSGH